MAPFFFDIETGGFSPSKGGRESSIFSISFGTTPKNVESFYAQPVEGSFVSRWSEKNVWEPIKRLRNVSIESEESILKKFLGKLEGLPEGQEIAGWNTGYVARSSGRGFDIPMLMARAEKYGLEGGYRQAFGKLTVRDVGQEYAYKIAKEVSRYGHLVEQGKLPETLFGQARGYAELGLSYEAGRPATERQASRYLAEEFKYVSGWKQEVAHGLFAKGGYQAHLSAADVGSGLGLTETLEKGRLFKGEAGVIKWGRETLYRSLVSQAMQPAGIRKGVQEVATEKYPRLLAEAKQMEKTGGKVYREFSERVVAGINEEVAQRGTAFGDILAGKGAPELGRVMGREGRLGSMAAEASGFSAFGRGSFAKKVPGFLWKHKVGVGIGAALLGTYATQPLGWFSGKDDAYNTIEGLSHGGETEKMRHLLTDFGSGWDALRGLKRAGETFGKMTASKSFQRALRESKFVKTLGKGKFGKVEERIGHFRGQEFKFARKTGELGKREVEAMQAVQETVGPNLYRQRTLYRQRKSILDMELFEGSTLKRLEPEALKKVSEAQIESALGKLHETGFVHGDSHLKNLMLVQTKQGPKVGIIDFGEASRHGAAGPSGDIAAALKLRKAQIEGISPLEALDPFAALSSVSGSRAANTIQGLGKGPFEHFGSPAILNKIVGFARKIFGQTKHIATFGKGPGKGVKGWTISAAELRAEGTSMPEFFGRMRQRGMSQEYTGGVIVRAKEEMAWRKLGIKEKGKTWKETEKMLKETGEGVMVPAGYKPTGMSRFASKTEVMRAIEKQHEAASVKFLKSGTGTFGARPSAMPKIPQPKSMPKISTGSAPAMPGMPAPSMPGVVRSKVPKHEAMIAEQVASAGRKARFHKAHTEGKIRASTNAHRPGRRHTDTTGKIVF